MMSCNFGCFATTQHQSSFSTAIPPCNHSLLVPTGTLCTTPTTLLNQNGYGVETYTERIVQTRLIP
eukprot:228640-Amphidinium_carterae.1